MDSQIRAVGAVWTAIILLLALIATSAFAQQHPMPLEKGITEDKCLVCHEDVTKGKVVHAAVTMGCFGCHTVRGSGDATRVSLKTPLSTSLCITCHSDKKAVDKRQHTHAPVGVDCLQCHTPHHSENKALLLRTEAGDKRSNLCLKCHKEGLDIPDKGSRHAALDKGCETCHVTHKSGPGSKQEIVYHLTKPAPALCLDCHDAKDAKLQQAHKGQPFGTAVCTNCHDPHQSKSLHLMQAHVHAPFADGCDSCHEAPQNGKVKLTQADTKSLCATCHDDVAKRIDTAKIPHTGAQGACTECHDPHAGKYPRFVRPDPVAVCDSCHQAQLEERGSKPVTHNPVGQQCSICHEPHGGDAPKLLRAPGDTLCLECHISGAAGALVAGTNDVTIFNKSVQLPESYLQRTPHLSLTKGGKGHPVQGHPVTGPDPSRPGTQLSCLRCHKAHVGEKKLLVTDSVSSASLCAECHAKPK